MKIKKERKEKKKGLRNISITHDRISHSSAFTRRLSYTKMGENYDHRGPDAARSLTH